jgi:hypothetical protein
MKYIKTYESNFFDTFQEDWEEVNDKEILSEKDIEWAKSVSNKYYFFMTTEKYNLFYDLIRVKVIFDEENNNFKVPFDDDVIDFYEFKNKFFIDEDGYNIFIFDKIDELIFKIYEVNIITIKTLELFLENNNNIDEELKIKLNKWIYSFNKLNNRNYMSNAIKKVLRGNVYLSDIID